MVQPLMPKATAVWLVENTSLTFEQIAQFCALHVLEVQGIADGEVAIGIHGLDPTGNGQLTREEIDRCQGDPSARLRPAKQDLPQPAKRTKGPRYTPVAKRQDKPDAIAWLLRQHPELKESQIAKLIGTTKNTIQAVNERTHWNSPNIRPRDPVLLGLCTQSELNAAVERAEKAAAKAGKPIAKPAEEEIPAEPEAAAEPARDDSPLTPEEVFAPLPEASDEPESADEEAPAEAEAAAKPDESDEENRKEVEGAG